MAKQSSARSTPLPRQRQPEALSADRAKPLNQMPRLHNASRTSPGRFFLRSGRLFRAAGQAKK